jgi:hypothetical protein
MVLASVPLDSSHYMGILKLEAAPGKSLARLSVERRGVLRAGPKGAPVMALHGFESGQTLLSNMTGLLLKSQKLFLFTGSAN